VRAQQQYLKFIEPIILANIDLPYGAVVQVETSLSRVPGKRKRVARAGRRMRLVCTDTLVRYERTVRLS